MNLLDIRLTHFGGRGPVIGVLVERTFDQHPNHRRNPGELRNSILFIIMPGQNENVSPQKGYCGGIWRGTLTDQIAPSN
jgi:hypothetical protein